MSEWHPIETAPRDGTRVLFYGEWPCGERPHGEANQYMVSGSYDGGGWAADEAPGAEVWGWLDPLPSHWKPLPEVPFSAEPGL